jgi:hypothetical protein
MPLPKTQHPLFETVLPSTKNKISFRQMLVREEKILLMAKSSKDDADINRAIKQVVNNCIMDANIDKFTTFDIEWMFLKIRSVSIGNVVELAFIDKEDEKEYDFEIDLDKVEMKWPEFEEGEGNKLVITPDEMGIFLRYPPASLFDETVASKAGEDAEEFVAAACIQKIAEKGDDEVHLAEDYTMHELVEFVKDLDIKSFNSIRNFIATTPHLFYEIEYKNSKGTERKITLTTLSDFFML